MKRLMNQVAHISILGLLIVAVVTGCRQAPNKPGAIGGGGALNAGAENSVPFPIELSLQAYDELIYEPVIEANCARCHHEHPYHGTLEDSHNYVAEKYINPESDIARILFEDPGDSQIIRKIATNHNCPEDNCTVEFLVDAVEKWVEKLEDTGWKVPIPEYPNSTEAVTFNGGQAVRLSFDPSIYQVGTAADGERQNSFANLSDDDPDGPILSYVGSESGNNIDNANDANAGLALYNFEVTTPGEHYLWMRVKLDNDDEARFFVRTDGEVDNFNLDSTGEDWDWRTVTDDDGDPIPYRTLEAGPTTIEIIQRDGGAKFNLIMLTPADDANRDQFVKDYYEIEYDISDMAGTNAKLIATVWPEAQEEDDVKVIGLESLRIESDEPVRVKSIRPLINGLYSSSNATYLLVDTVVGGSDDREQQVIRTGGASGTIFLADMERDELSFSFEIVEKAN